MNKEGQRGWLPFGVSVISRGVCRIWYMGHASIAEVESLLQGVRFHPPPVIAVGARPPLLPRTIPKAASVAIAATALACVVLLVFVFWSAVIHLVA